MLILHHFTSMRNWERIRQAAFLALSDSSVHARKGGPPVVWLTTRETGEGLGLAQGSTARKLSDFDQIDKTRVRLSVEVGRAATYKWADFAIKHGGDPNWVAHVRREVEHAGSWRVHTRTIPRDRWVDCYDTYTGTRLSIAPTLQQLGFKKLHAGQRG